MYRSLSSIQRTRSAWDCRRFRLGINPAPETMQGKPAAMATLQAAAPPHSGHSSGSNRPCRQPFYARPAARPGRYRPTWWLQTGGIADRCPADPLPAETAVLHLMRCIALSAWVHPAFGVSYSSGKMAICKAGRLFYPKAAAASANRPDASRMPRYLLRGLLRCNQRIGGGLRVPSSYSRFRMAGLSPWASPCRNTCTASAFCPAINNSLA